MPDDASGFIQKGVHVTNWSSSVTASDQVGPATVMAVLRALAAMARISRRHEADVGSALQGSGLRLDPEQRDAALQQLKQAECIERIIPLTDGGILVSVTAAGLSRAANN